MADLSGSDFWPDIPDIPFCDLPCHKDYASLSNILFAVTYKTFQQVC
jgi:hypothetical protein